MDFAFSRDGSDERRFVLAAKLAHFCEGDFKCRGHVPGGHIARRENELRDRMLAECALFEKVVTNVFIRREQDPSVGSHHRKPLFIRCAALEVNEVALEANPQLCQHVKNRMGVAQIFVEEEDKVIRRRWEWRAPSG